MIQRKMTAAVPSLVFAMTGFVMAADSDSNVLKTSGALDRLVKQSGVYNTSPTGKTPNFVVDPSWPQPLPNNWILGQIGGLYVDPHDHIWIYNRPRTLTNEEAGPRRTLARRHRRKRPAHQRPGSSATLHLHQRLL
jgi:hypothetical protein